MLVLATLLASFCSCFVAGDGLEVVMQYDSCPEFFEYKASRESGVYGLLKLKNNFDGRYRLEVQMAIPLMTDKTIEVTLETDVKDAEEAEYLEYRVKLPFNRTLPHVTSVSLNGDVRCTGPPGVGKTVTNLTATHEFSTEKTKINSKRCGSIDAEGNPWLVALFNTTTAGKHHFVCGGSLITDRHIITAAHCIRNRLGVQTKDEDLVVAFGNVNIKSWQDQTTVTRRVQKSAVNPDYVTPADADVAVLTLDKPVKFNDTVRPLCIWDDDSNLSLISGRTGSFSGWGGEEVDQHLNEARTIRLPVVTQESCLRLDEKYFNLVSSRTFCAGDLTNAVPCNGDAGGPFVIKWKDRWTLRGVASTSLLKRKSNICDTGRYSVFSDVTAFKDWIILETLK